jgi:diguanylate cyclase (GGDEF)-like protein
VADPSPAETGRILVIEDEPRLRFILERQLREAKDARYEVRTAEDGIKGLAEVLREPPELILLDVMMPGMDGFEVCRRLKANPLTSRIPIIFLTAKSTVGDRLRGLELYADDYLTKPWEQQELLFRVRNQLKTRRAQLSSNALTGLPGNVLIETELTRRIGAGEKFAFLHLDLDAFKAFNDYYGYARGDALIRFTAALLQEQVLRRGGEGDFVGHIGGDDFVIITVPERAQPIAEAVKAEFDARVPDQYDPADREARRITVLSSRQGGWRDFEILSITILIVTNVGVEIQHSAQVSDTAKDLKKRGKAIQGSVIVYDRRTEPTPPIAAAPKPAAGPHPPAPPQPPSEGPRGAGEP